MSAHYHEDGFWSIGDDLYALRDSPGWRNRPGPVGFDAKCLKCGDIIAVDVHHYEVPVRHHMEQHMVSHVIASLLTNMGGGGI